MESAEKNNEKISPSSSNESRDVKGTRRTQPDMRLFKLEKKLQVLEKIEDDKLTAKNLA